MREALAALGLRLSPQRLGRSPIRYRRGREGLREVLEGPVRPPPWLAATTCSPSGRWPSANEQGIAVPREVRSPGSTTWNRCGGHAGAHNGALSTEELGALAAPHLLARLAGRQVELRTELPVELVVRASTAPQRGDGCERR